jgi:hypothetical protein
MGAGINLARPSFRTLSFAAFLCTFGAVWGFATFGYTFKVADGSEDSGLLWVWVGLAFVGSILIALKNQSLSERSLRLRVYLADLTVLAAALIAIAALPDFIGLVKSLVVLGLFFGYALWYFKALETQL